MSAEISIGCSVLHCYMGSDLYREPPLALSAKFQWSIYNKALYNALAVDQAYKSCDIFY
jgi:hypothetical protein